MWTCNGMVLDEVEGFYSQFGRLPVFFQFWQRNPGEFYPESFCSQAWHRQKELNEVETQTREASELLARTKVTVPRQAKVAADEITATTSQVIVYNDAASRGPEYMMPPPIPVALIERRRQLMDDIRMQGTITDQDMGTMSSDPNGRAMAIVEAESDRQLGPLLTRNWRELAELHRCALIMARKMYHPERQLLVSGEYGHELASMQEINLSDGWDVEIELEDGLSKNQAVRFQQVMQWVQSGLLMQETAQGPVPDMTKAAKLARLKIPGIGPDITSSEYAAANNMMLQIERGNSEAAYGMIGLEDDPKIFSEVLLNWLRKKGRQTKDPMQTETARDLYMFYTQWTLAQEMGAPMPQAPGQPQQPGAAGGPMPGAPGPQPGGNDIEQEAGQQVQQADQMGENQARMSDQHES